jgi:uncharacterized membrane protein
MERSNPNSWAVTLTPHRSLSKGGFIAIMGLIAAVNFAAGGAFFLAGAWPVAGFCGLDVTLVWWAFRRNFADARRCERVEITEREVILERQAKGRERQVQRFVRHWVRVDLEEDRDRELIGGLYLASGGRREEIGRFLAPWERKELARALKAALARPGV